MNKLSVCLLFAFVAYAMSAEVYSISIPCDTKTATYTIQVNRRATNFSTFHCFGEFDQYTSVITTPNKTHHDFATLWDAGKLYSTIGYTNATEGPVNFLFIALKDYSSTNNGTCASFSLAVTYSPSDFAELYAQPVNVTAYPKLSADGKSGSVTWAKTQNPNDTYSVYYTTLKSAPTGQNMATTCSIKQWMSLFTSNDGKITYNDDGTFTASKDNLDPKTPYTLVAIAERENALGGVYQSMILNGKNNAGIIVPSIIATTILALAIIF